MKFFFLVILVLIWGFFNENSAHFDYNFNFLIKKGEQTVVYPLMSLCFLCIFKKLERTSCFEVDNDFKLWSYEMEEGGRTARGD